MKKLQRELSKTGQEAEKMQAQVANASFISNSETEREKYSTSFFL
jgi:hypothetical protein